MIVVLQRVSRAEVRVGGATVAAIGSGFLALAGAVEGDDEGDADRLARRIVNLRVFADDEGKMNRSLLDVGGSLLLVSQFTLAADTRKGRRPSFVRALAPEHAEPLIEVLAGRLRQQGAPVETGVFGADMAVELVNDGPVTLLMDSRETRRGNVRETESGA